MFQLAFLSECIITPFYWFLLNNKDSYRPDDMVFNIKMVGDHSLPLIVLLIDFSMNTVPFCNKHFVLVCAVLVLYLIVNYLVTIFRDKPVYPVLDWDSAFGLSLPPIVFIYLTLVFLPVKWLSHQKLLRNGYSLFLVALYGDLRAHTNISQLIEEKDVFGITGHTAKRHKSTA